MPILYVLAGPNGVGKTTAFKEIIPSGTDYINADLIAKTIREGAGGLNTQELANSEASRIFWEKIEKNETFAIETNLADNATFRSFLSVQEKEGYELNIIFLSVGDVNVCIERVAQRVRENGHNITPPVIKERYINGLSLLSHYKNFIDRLLILDNAGRPVKQAELRKGIVLYRNENLEPWVFNVLESSSKKQSHAIKPNSIEDAKRKYEELKAAAARKKGFSF